MRDFQKFLVQAQDFVWVFWGGSAICVVQGNREVATCDGGDFCADAALCARTDAERWGTGNRQVVWLSCQIWIGVKRVFSPIVDLHDDSPGWHDRMQNCAAGLSPMTWNQVIKTTRTIAGRKHLFHAQQSIALWASGGGVLFFATYEPFATVRNRRLMLFVRVGTLPALQPNCPIKVSTNCFQHLFDQLTTP